MILSKKQIYYRQIFFKNCLLCHILIQGKKLPIHYEYLQEVWIDTYNLENLDLKKNEKLFMLMMLM